MDSLEIKAGSSTLRASKPHVRALMTDLDVTSDILVWSISSQLRPCSSRSAQNEP